MSANRRTRPEREKLGRTGPGSDPAPRQLPALDKRARIRGYVRSCHVRRMIALLYNTIRHTETCGNLLCFHLLFVKVLASVAEVRF